MKFCKPVIILRKKIEGENSIEELAYAIRRNVDVEVIVCPYSSATIRGMIGNICYFIQIKAPVYHIMTPSEAYLLPFLRNGKRIITYHDLGTIYESRNFLYQKFRVLTQLVPSRLFADAITFVSNQTCKEYIKAFPKIKKERLKIIYNAYDQRLQPKETCKHDKPLILQIGTAPRKNLEATIQAVSGLDVKLSIIGKLRKNQEELLKELKIDFSNRYDVSYEEIVEEYVNCDMVLFPTFYEGFGLPIIEANGMRRPIIASNIDILREVGGKAVFYIDPHNVQSITEAIKKMLGDENLRMAYVREGEKNASRFSPSKIYKEYRMLYLGE